MASPWSTFSRSPSRKPTLRADCWAVSFSSSTTTPSRACNSTPSSLSRLRLKTKLQSCMAASRPPRGRSSARCSTSSRRSISTTLNMRAAAGMNKSIPMASTTFGVGNEQIVLSPEEANGMLVCYNYFEGVKNPANTAFLDAFHKRFGADYPNVTELAMGTYQGFKLWAEGVRKAESIDRLKVIDGLETGISIYAPAVQVTI